MRLGLSFDEVLGWQGGRDFAFMVHQSLILAREPGDEITILTQEMKDSTPWRVARIAKHVLTQRTWDTDWIRAEMERPRRKHFIQQVIGPCERLEWMPSRWSRCAAGRAFDVVGLFQAQPDGLGETGWVGYLPDCQHKHLPSFFLPTERDRRDETYAKMLANAPVVIVNSRHAAADLAHFFGPFRAEVVPLPFSAAPDPAWLSVEGEVVRARYGLPDEYFICSNQFWAHKNHATVFKALKISRSRGKPFFVAFTGDTRDFKDPDFVPRLLKEVEALDVGECFKILGLIPKIDQIGLLKASRALIQPTLFEGGPGGGAAYDAIALGKTVILSDIPVNREIETFDVTYFEPQSAEALADVVADRLRETRRSALVEDHIRAGLERRRECGRVLRAAFLKAAGGSAQTRAAMDELARARDSA